jgi:hypothetical protein
MTGWWFFALGLFSAEKGAVAVISLPLQEGT